MKIDFIKVNPVENMTILVNSTVKRENYGKIAQELMKYSNIYAEQVGFIENNHLQMMGGEFCGNASRSFAAYLAFKDKEFQNEKTYTITCSGASKELSVLVRRNGNYENQFFASIAMPNPLSIKEESISIDTDTISLIRIDFDGITHFILENNYNKEKMINFITEKMINEKYEAFGIMFFNKEKNEILPFVYVNGLGGTFERSCASGSTALGHYLKNKYHLHRAKISQPGGFLEYYFNNNTLYIDGPVEIVAEGSSYINLLL